MESQNAKVWAHHRDRIGHMGSGVRRRERNHLSCWAVVMSSSVIGGRGESVLAWEKDELSRLLPKRQVVPVTTCDV